MGSPALSALEIRDRTAAFTEAFNRDDLEAVMDAFSDDAIYDEYDGRRHVGRAAVRAALEPQFRGDFGEIRFDAEDLFVDPETQRSLVSWTCRIQKPGRVLRWRGLDVLVFRGDRIVEKRTYAKAKKLAFTPED